jgi:chromosome segregation ATPase
LQLDEATASLDLKTSTILELETRVNELQTTLDGITADLEATRQNLEVAEVAKATAERELAETSAASLASQGERDKLGQVSDEVRHIFAYGS